MNKKFYEKKIIFFGTPVWELTSRHLKMFLENNANIVAFVEADIEKLSTTVTKEDPYENITSVARRLNIPTYIPKNLKEPEFIKYLKSFNADIFIVCGFQFYIPEIVLEIPPMGVINFHSSLLPRHCGMHPGFFTIWYGDRESGMTIHLMDNGLDTGDIIYQSKVPVYPDDSIASLYDRIWDSTEALIPKLLDNIERGILPRKPQDMSRYFYNYEISDKDFELDFRQPADVLCGRIKMMPGRFYYIWDGKRYYVGDCAVIKEPKKNRCYNFRTPIDNDGKIIFLTPRNYLQIERISEVR